LALIAKPGYADCIELKDQTGDENKAKVEHAGMFQLSPLDLGMNGERSIG
jgi:hypothetical protein